VDNPSTQRIPTNRLPALQRPTPSRCIRLHLDTHAKLSCWRQPGESFDMLVQRLMRLWEFEAHLREREDKTP
jgi:hypothetical protein